MDTFYKTIPRALVFLIFTACIEYARFEEPQPVGKPNLKTIPSKFRGSYSSGTDVTNLTITETEIIEWAQIVNRTIMDSIDLEIDSAIIDRSTEDSIVVIDGKHHLSYKFIPVDSVIIYYSYRDTLFRISSDHLIRRFKEHCFLNYKRMDDDWLVTRLTLDKDRLIFSKIKIPLDTSIIYQVADHEEIKSDSGKVVGYKLNPTRHELKQLMKHHTMPGKTFLKND